MIFLVIYSSRLKKSTVDFTRNKHVYNYNSFTKITSLFFLIKQHVTSINITVFHDFKQSNMLFYITYRENRLLFPIHNPVFFFFFFFFISNFIENIFDIWFSFIKWDMNSRKSLKECCCFSSTKSLKRCFFLME